MASALAGCGVELDVFMARKGAPKQDLPLTVVPPPKASTAAREVHMLAASAAMVEALSARWPHDAVYERLSLFGAAGLAYASAQEIPLVVEVNAPLWDEAHRYRTLHLERAARALALDVMAGAKQVIVVTKELERILVAEGVEPSKVTVIGNGINPRLFADAEPAPRPAALADKPLLVFCGSLKPWHGIEFLLDAFQALICETPAGLWIIGEGPLRELVEQAAGECPNIVYEGPVEHERIGSMLRAADIAVAPYPADAPSYFSPLKVVEAIAAGCSLVASNTLGVREAAADGTSVHLFQPDDRDGFVRAVQQALAARPDPTAREFPDQLSWSAKARRVLKLLGWPAEDCTRQA